ncbi:hypothetical protein [Gracilimonas tropica]|uniref:hypothetical protein n=1 Tax=Gracilimonas tropica TaxID=454600 RepID=UPI00035D72C9|nr:hypothetical protein [Gracilimonas tropica]
MSDFPTDPEVLHIKEADGKAVRARLVDIENVNQPGTRFKNAVHIELFDRIEIGNLKRFEHDTFDNGDSEKEYDIDSGIILCNKRAKDTSVFHSNEKKASCKKCISIANRLINKGLSIYLCDKETWDLLQDIMIKNIVHKLASNR